MKKEELISFYEKRRIAFTEELSIEKRKINWISNLRIATALAIVVIVYFSFHNTTLFLASIPLLTLFGYLVKRHVKLFNRKVHLENLLKVNGSEIAGLKGDFSAFHAGDEFIDPHHQYTHDLDIFGDGSVFQSINRCNTKDGKRTLAKLLSTHLPSALDIRLHQEAAKELALKTDFRQDLVASGMEIDEQLRDRDELMAWLNVPAFIYGQPLMHVALWLIPALTLLALAGVMWAVIPKAILMLLVIVQWAMFSNFGKRITVFHEYISRKKIILEKYAHILKVLQPEKFDSERMRTLREKANDADVKVSNLASLVSALNARLNFLTATVVNSFLMYDLQFVYRLEKWKHENSANLQDWLNAICEAEVLCSFGTFAFNNPGFVYPVIHDHLAIEADEIGHPLLSSEPCVTNSISLGKDQSILIITGANMAGKSTFLRTIGVNLVLALAGSPVYATTFRCPVIPIRSGMRTADSLKDHESYFYAELHRLKSIMDELRSGKPLFILLDEILKGTNSGDKQKGSIALVKQLLLNPCLAIVATHDLALGELERQYPGHVRNYCFEATIENDQLSFDYALKPGVAQKMNATFLMKQMGIIRD